MSTKKLIAAILFLAVIAAVALGIVISRKNSAESQVTALNAEIETIKGQIEEAVKNAAAQVQSAKDEMQQAADEATQAVNAQLEEAKQALQAAEDKAAQLAAELKTAQDAAAELTEAKEKAEAEARQATEELNRIRAAVSAVMNGTPEEEAVPIAMIYYENADHTVHAYGNDFTAGVTASVADVQAEGAYTASLTFDQPAEGLYFLALSIENAEQAYPGWVIDVKEVKVNGEAIALGKGYTTSDDGLRTRVNLFNEWETKLPDDARALTADLTDASAAIVSPEAFTAVETLEVTFDYLSPETVAAARAVAAEAAEAAEAPAEAPAENQ